MFFKRKLSTYILHNFALNTIFSVLSFYFVLFFANIKPFDILNFIAYTKEITHY